MRLIYLISLIVIIAMSGCGAQPQPDVVQQDIAIDAISMDVGDVLDVKCDGVLGLDLDTAGSGQLFCGALPIETATDTPTVEVVATDTETPQPTATETDTEISTPTGTNTDTPTATPSDNETATGTPTGTSTPIDTSTSTSTPVKPPTIAPPVGTPSASWPVCVNHDATKWHSMVDMQNGCRYEHHHGDDPAQCDPLLTQWLGALPDTISYEWQTPNENTLKHGGYINLCRVFNRPGVNGNLANDLNWIGKTPNAVAGVFLQIHRHPGRMDREKPLHSYRLWMYSCKIANGGIDWSQCGTFKTGGWAHMGIFHCIYKEKYCQRPLDLPVPANHWIPGVGMDTSGKSIDPYIAINKPISITLQRLGLFPEAWSSSGTLRLDNNQDVWDLWVTGPGIYGKDSTGNGYNWNAGFGALSTDDPESVNVAAYDAALASGKTITESYALLNVPICDYAPTGAFCRFDGSEHAIFTAYTQVPASWDGGSLDADGARNGFVTLSTYTDLRGNIRTSCTEASSVCVPLVLEHAPVGWAGRNATVSAYPNGKEPGNLREYNPYSLPIHHH